MTQPIELILITALLERNVVADVSHAGTEWPDDLETRLPFVAVRRVAGPVGPLNDYPVVDIDVFAATYAELDTLCPAVDEAINGPKRVRSVVIGGHRYPIDRAYGNKGFSKLPWDGDERRYGAVYAFVTRRG